MRFLASLGMTKAYANPKAIVIPNPEGGEEPPPILLIKEIFSNLSYANKTFIIFAASGAPRPSHLALLCVGWLTDRLSKQSRSRGDYEIKGDFGLLFYSASRQIVSGAVARAIRRYVGTRHVTSQMALDLLVTFLSRKK